MADLMAIVSKAVFEKEAGKDPKVGTVLGMDRYVSANKNLEPLADGGRLFLVTVRPPDEKLWLVAILDKPKFDGSQWKAKASTVAITDIGKLKSKLKFESGKGISAAPGALGMSLQTPRALTANDVALLDGAAGATPAASVDEAPAAPKAKGKGKVQIDGAKDAPSGVAPAGGQREAMLAAILAEPGNLDARRVYADVLTTHNDRRGEFIMLELALAGRLSIRRREELERRRAELVKQYFKTWFPFKATMRTANGFVSRVEGTYSSLASVAPRLFDVEPVTDVELSFADKDVAKFVKSGWAPRVRHLSVRSSLKDEGFTALVTAPTLQGLTLLNVTDCGITAAGLTALAGKLPALRSLSLTANRIGDAGATSLAGWDGLGRLETLYVSSCGLTEKGVAALLAKPTSLRTLCLRRNDLDPGIAKVFKAAAPRLPHLRRLELNNTEVDNATVEKILAALPQLTAVDVRHAAVGVDPGDPRVRRY